MATFVYIEYVNILLTWINISNSKTTKENDYMIYMHNAAFRLYVCICVSEASNWYIYAFLIFNLLMFETHFI